jgi:hypothetical protein
MKKIFLTLAAILLLAISNISNFNVFAVAISEYSTQTQHRSSINCFEGDPLEKIDYVGSPVGTISCNLSPTVSGDES